MSLVCNQCNQDMGPSESFPGREGVMVHPIVMALAYLPTSQGLSYQASYLWASQNLSLCFSCIEEKLPEERKSSLIKVYQAYEDETRLGEIKDQLVGRWVGAREARPWSEAYDKAEASFNALEKECLFCGANVRNGKPYFTAKVIDRVYSRKNLSGIPIPGISGMSNYSWSNMKKGRTFVNFCFDDFRQHFFPLFEGLSHTLTGNRNPNLKPGMNEIYLSPEFEQAFEGQTGKSIDKAIRELSEGTENLRIIRREKEE